MTPDECHTAAGIYHRQVTAAVLRVPDCPEDQRWALGTQMLRDAAAAQMFDRLAEGGAAVCELFFRLLTDWTGEIAELLDTAEALAANADDDTGDTVGTVPTVE